MRHDELLQSDFVEVERLRCGVGGEDVIDFIVLDLDELVGVVVVVVVRFGQIQRVIDC